MQFQFIETADGSPTLKDTETGELYHNRAGAYTEALLNYVNPSGALKRLKRTGSLQIFDACFGLGYNSFVLLSEAIEQRLEGSIVIDAVDNNPALIEALPTVLRHGKFERLSKNFQLHNRFTDGPLTMQLRLHTCSLPQELKVFLGEHGKIGDRSSDLLDLVFHDPFSPKRVPELWTIDIFQLYKRLLCAAHGAVLTYSCATAVTGSLIKAGFKVGRTSSVGAKSGGTIAFLGTNEENDFDVLPLGGEELARLETHSSVPYRDPEFKLDRQEILKRRFLEQEQFRRLPEPD